MDEFEIVWETSRQNAWSFAYPTTFVVGILVLLGLCFIRNPICRRLLKVLALFTFSILAVFASSWEIEEKWRLRGAYADTHPMTDKQWSALTVDGANRTLGPLIFGFQATAAFVALLSAAWMIRVIFQTHLAHFRQDEIEESNSARSPVWK